LRNEPLPGDNFIKAYRFFRAGMVTDSAAFTGKRIYLKIIGYGLETTEFQAKFATTAFIPLDKSLPGSFKIAGFFESRAHNKV
jgi:hypothetical protein